MLDNAFTFQAGARPIEQRPKYRSDSRAPDGPCMITVDPRVYRGSTYVKKRPEAEEEQTIRTKRRPVEQKTRALDLGPMNMQPKRDNRIDLEIQTEPYLQEVYEKPVLLDLDSQTDTFLDRPETPPYIPPKNGVDVEIQVDESELFDFDFEVQPIVSIIVGKTIEQAFLEVHEEEELAAIRRHKNAIEHQRNVELADIQRLEEAERRKFDEKQKRLEERAKVEAEQAQLRQKILSRGFAGFFTSDLIGDVISDLERRGYFYDEVEREIETTFIPWLSESMNEVSETKLLTSSISEEVNKTALAVEQRLRDEIISLQNESDKKTDEEMKSALRVMIVEDIAGRRIRDAMRNQKKSKPKDEDQDDEDDE